MNKQYLKLLKLLPLIACLCLSAASVNAQLPAWENSFCERPEYFGRMVGEGQYLYVLGRDNTDCGEVWRWSVCAGWEKIGRFENVTPELGRRYTYMYDLTIGGGCLYVCGNFTGMIDAGGNPLMAATKVSRFDLSSCTWSALGDPGRIPYSIAVDSFTNVYIGSGFAAPGDWDSEAIMKWNGSSWSGVGGRLRWMTDNSMAPVIENLATDGTNIYAVASFDRGDSPTQPQGIELPRMAKWNPLLSCWQYMAGFTNDTQFYDIAVVGDNVFVAGLWIGIRRFGTDGAILSTGCLTNPGVGQSLAVRNGKLYIAGAFRGVKTAGGDIVANSIVVWDSSSDSWSTLGGGLTYSDGRLGIGYDVAATENAVVVQGNFDRAGGTPIYSGMARWVMAADSCQAPRLAITHLNNTVVVSWPSSLTCWNLEQNLDLNTTNWVAPPESVMDDGSNRFIVVAPPTGNRFYRLHRP